MISHTGWPTEQFPKAEVRLSLSRESTQTHMNQILRIARQYAAGVLILLIFPVVSSAEILAERLSCGIGSATRIIDLVYEGPIGGLPCLIREHKRGHQPAVLWRARNQVDFCTNQIDAYRKKLMDAGFRCEWLADDDSLSLNEWIARQFADDASEAVIETTSNTYISEASETADDGYVSDVVSWTILSLTGSEKNKTQESQASLNIRKQRPLQSVVASVRTGNSINNYLDEDLTNAIEAFSSFYGVLPELSGEHGVFSETNIPLDSWIVYLNGVALAGIKALLADSPEAFEEYWIFERQNAQTIYGRLQLRINQLTKIAKLQRGNSGSIKTTQIR